MEHLTKHYRYRRNCQGTNSIVVGFPFEVLDRAARRLNITLDEFLEKYQATVHYDDTDIVHYTFEKI